MNYTTFKLLDDNNIINIYTKKPYNFNKNQKTKEEMFIEINDIEQKINYKFKYVKTPVQEHTNIVKKVTNENINDELIGVDGLITDIKGLALYTKTADCQAILLYDKENEIIGNIHSGWKGTLNKIIVNAINIMINDYKSKTENIIVCICPSIQKCCFEVGEELVNQFKQNFDNIDDYITMGDIKDNKQKYYIDTISINKKVLLGLGIKEENIEISNVCTKCHNNEYHSYRYEHEDAGRNAAIICMK